MRQLIYILLVALPVYSVAQNLPEDEMEEKLIAVMVLFEQSQKDLRNEISALQAQLLEKENLVAELETQLKQQVDLNYELAAQVLAQNVSGDGNAAYTVVDTNEVAANRGRAAAQVQFSDGPKNVSEEELVDLNSATLEEILELPVMNELVADRIIQGRPWALLEDLIQLQGVGQMRLSRWQPYVTIRPVAEGSGDSE